MKNIPNIKVFYTRIQHQLFNLIPEKWESIYLYASVSKQINKSETWEMYFYYTPKGFLKRNAINVYEIPNKFNVDEQQYLKLVDNLCNTIKKLYVEYKETYDKDWSTVVISIKNSQFLIEYNCDTLFNEKYTSEERHLIFQHRYLNVPLQHFNKNERCCIERFLDDLEVNEFCDRYFEYIKDFNLRNYIEYEKNEYILGIEENKLAIVKRKKFDFWKLLKKRQEAAV